VDRPGSVTQVAEWTVCQASAALQGEFIIGCNRQSSKVKLGINLLTNGGGEVNAQVQLL